MHQQRYKLGCASKLPSDVHLGASSLDIQNLQGLGVERLLHALAGADIAKARFPHEAIMVEGASPSVGLSLTPESPLRASYKELHG